MSPDFFTTTLQMSDEWRLHLFFRKSNLIKGRAFQIKWNLRARRMFSIAQRWRLGLPARQTSPASSRGPIKMGSRINLSPKHRRFGGQICHQNPNHRQAFIGINYWFSANYKSGNKRRPKRKEKELKAGAFVHFEICICSRNWIGKTKMAERLG